MDQISVPSNGCFWQWGSRKKLLRICVWNDAWKAEYSSIAVHVGRPYGRVPLYPMSWHSRLLNGPESDAFVSENLKCGPFEILRGRLVGAPGSGNRGGMVHIGSKEFDIFAGPSGRPAFDRRNFASAEQVKIVSYLNRQIGDE